MGGFDCLLSAGLRDFGFLMPCGNKLMTSLGLLRF